MVLEHTVVPHPELETERQRRVDELYLTSHGQDPVFEKLVELTARCLNVPIAFVSVLDNQRQWFLARVGLGIEEIPRHQSFCVYALEQQLPLQVIDASVDPRFRDNPLVTGTPGIRFYAGVPLVTDDGLMLGSLSIIDTTPRHQLDAEELVTLQKLADLVMSRMMAMRDRSFIDPATGLFNSVRLSDDILRLQERAAHSNVILVDVFALQYVKDVVKALGYGFFNDMLVETTRTLQNILPIGTSLYKVSPTRFAVLLENSSREACESLSGLLLESLKLPVPCKGIPIQTQAAIGLLPLHPGVADHASWLRLSISAADYASGFSEGWAWFTPELESTHQRSFALLGGIGPALLANDQFRLEYQPKLSMKDGSCTGVEALLRWRHPELGNVGPAEFIPLAEKTALVHDLTLWVLHEALQQLQKWRAQGVNLVVSINISAGDLETPVFAQQLRENIQRCGIEPEALELEFTESVLMSNPQAVREQLQRLRQEGVQVAIDDFGTGYSNWSYLREIPASALKIDKSFVDGLQQHNVNRRLVTTIIELAHELGYRVIAEGVETQQDYDLLASWDCDEVQGYLIAKPMPPEALVRWLGDRAIQS